MIYANIMRSTLHNTALKYMLDLHCICHVLFVNYESVVSLVARRYTRAGIGNERLVVCLSEYLP